MRRTRGRIGKFGLLVAFVGLLWGVAEGLLNLASAEAFADKISAWLFRYLRSGYTQPLCTGLLLIGIATRSKRTTRRLGALTLATGAIGWAFVVTDTNAVITGIFERRTAHVGFGVLFAMGWIALGLVLQNRRRSEQKRHGGISSEN